MIKLNDFAKTLGRNPRAFRDALKKNPERYPTARKQPGRNGIYLINKKEADEWLESLKVT